jgi:hypothetical protein
MTGRALIIIETQEDRAKAARWAQGVKVGSRIEFKETKRSVPQSDFMWALLTDVAQQVEHGGKKYDATQWKSIYLHAFGREISFLPSLDLKTFLPIELSSSDLGKGEMSDFIEFIIKEGTERGVVFHIPKDSHSQTDEESAPSSGADDTHASVLSEEREQVSSPDSANDRSAEPTPSQEPAGRSSPSTFKFADGELVHLQDFARKALRDAASSNDPSSKVSTIGRMIISYRTVIMSKDGRKAIEAMEIPFQAIMDGKRTREQAADYIARDILGVDPDELKGRGNG